ncbi:MAG: hypothetical protein IPI44_23990 [Sulfuritalea sp.]|nr:hypothetical protein [Sulfuritalea sp.]
MDRHGDVLKHANSAGTAKHGGVLMVAGDDHAARSTWWRNSRRARLQWRDDPVRKSRRGCRKSSTWALHGCAMSRYSGCWVGSRRWPIPSNPRRRWMFRRTAMQIVLPADYAPAAEGLNIRWPDDRVAQEARLLDHKLYAALALLPRQPD